MEATFCFVDIAGFTALTEAHGGHAAADLVDRFNVLVRDSLEGRGTVVNRIGDAVFVVSPSPTDALEFLSRLFTAASVEPNFPVLRAGLHHGDAVERDGTYFGAAVNLAARVASEARGGRIVATESVRAAAGGSVFAFVPLGSTTLRNVRDPVELYEAVLERSPPRRVTDPVCRMQVEPDASAARLHYDDTPYWFCSLDCARRFLTAPEAYVRQEGAGST